MQNLIYILSLAIFISVAAAQGNPANNGGIKLRPDNQGRMLIDGSKQAYTGKYSSYYPNGQEFEEKTYEDGVLRKQFSWDKFGKKRTVKIFETDGVLKDYIVWYPNGQKAHEEYYEDHKKLGVSASWNEQGQIISEAHYTNGRLNGLMTEWYDNGQKSREENRVNGIRVGPVSRWEKDGTRIIRKK